MNAENTRTCLVCGARFPATKEFCPICMLREALGEQVKAADSSRGKRGLALAPKHRSRQFDQYELVVDKDRKPVELGRGAMGVTYKAFDINLRCPVTLKVISERHMGDESARLRFLREARAAASVRHQNVASVLHLGKGAGNYFYAMEFVEGETLENLIKRSGRLDVKLALEIATQVAAGLAAIHEQNLVHRDIKPTNIMVRLKEEGGVTAKIIDLGLAKTLGESASEAGISSPGAFVGTPEFASPEQFAGVDVDIRSDLYSLGVTLWIMVTGQAPFCGPSAEVMYKHQQALLPLEQLKDVPEPVVVLLEKLLEKDPAQRFRIPSELLRAMPTITGAIDARRRMTRQSLLKTPSTASRVGTRKPLARLGPRKISVARLPITGTDLFGREEDMAFLDSSWANQRINIVTIVAWAGVGKSALVNHWLGRMAAEDYRFAELVFAWSFYRQGTGGQSSSADEFLDVALAWFGDPNPRIGTEWEKGERLARLIARRRTLLVLDGLEPLQNPPGPAEGRVRHPSLQVLLRELAAFNRGLCVITTRMPVTDIADHESTSSRRRELEQLSADAGAKLLRTLGVKGQEAELRSASEDFGGHCLALTLLGSFLTDAFNGDIRCRKEVSALLTHDLRHGAHARRVMESYKTWFGEGPELSLLRMLGLFDRPADREAVGALLRRPAIRGLTESLTSLSPIEWRTILGGLRRARLLAGEDPHSPANLDAHPLVREYFGAQLRSERTEAWRECNRRLYDHYRSLVRGHPDTFREMEPLFLAVTCGCNAGLFREALHEIYASRIQRGNVYFAANVLGARGALLSVLVHFFEQERWDAPVHTGNGGQTLTADDQLFILAQSAQYLTAIRGMGSVEARLCCQHMESVCRTVDRPQLLYVALMGQWRYSLTSDKASVSLQLAQRIHSLAQEQNDPAFMVGACIALAQALYFMGDFETAGRHATRGVQIWRSEGAHSRVEDVDAPIVTCLLYTALCQWHLGNITSCRVASIEAVSLAKELNDAYVLANALFDSALLAYFENNLSDVERLTSEVIELSMRHKFAFWLAIGSIMRGWARSASGHIADGISWIEDGLREYRGAGWTLGLPFYLAVKAQAFYLADRPSEALEALGEAEALAESLEVRWWCAELRRFRGVFLTAIGAEATDIEASFAAAIRIARGQKSISLEKRAEATYAEYCRRKVSAPAEYMFRLSLC